MITAFKHGSGHRVLLTFLAVFALSFGPISPLQQAARAATVTGLTTKSALVSAITAATAGDTLVLGSDIVVDTAVISIAKNITIDGNGYTITVPNVGVLDDGTNSTSASTWGVFSFTTGSSGSTLRNLSIKGGNSSTGAVNIGAGLSITIQSCNITNSRNSGSGGGGIKNSGTLFLRDTNVTRNSASYGGGFQNSGSIYVERSSFTENRSESSGGGGGAGENTGAGSYLYVNNSTFANNVSSEIGGAINNYQGNLYAVNSTFTGNVTVASSTYGGAIGKNGGTVNVASSLFAYNYSLSGGSSSSPTAYQLDDIDYGAATLAYSMYHGVVYSGSTKVQNVQYTAAADGSNDTIFSGGTNGKVTNGSGVQIGTATVFRPALTTVNGHRVVAIKTGSLPIGIGTPTYFGTSAARFSYYDRLAGTPAWVSMLGSATSTDLVTTDQLGTTRSSTTPTAGAVETGGTALYVVKSIAATDGTVDGGASIYGNTYASGTSVTVTALPNAGKVFSKWQVVVGTSTSVDVTSNPYTFSVTANTTLTPVFAASPVNTYTVSYSANNATAGSPPSAQTFTVGGSALTAASNSGSLSRTGYSFGGWSTTASGSGTIYAAGSGAFTPSANMTLYAYWVPPAAPNVIVGSVSYSLTTGTTATITPTNSGGAATSWSISPVAPAGMNFGTSTGVLTGTPTTVQSSTSYTITATNVTGSATATFTIAISNPVVVPAVYSVTYNYNSATGGNSTTSASFTVGGSALTLPTPTRSGYTFAGWYSESALTNQVGVGGGAYSPSADIGLYAKWTANSLTVTYNANGGSSVPSGSTTTGASISSAPTAPTKAGYTFVGWYSDSGLTTAVTFPYTHGQTADFTLYAKWAAGTYTVTYNYNSATGGNGVSSDSFTTGGSAITLPTPTKTGYGFGGWYSDSGLTVSIGGAGASYSPTSNAALYAKWTANSIVVSYESNGGTTITSGSTTTGATISLAPTAPTKTGYTFVGWYSDSGLTTSASFPYAHGRTADFTLYAKWSGGTYTVTYNYNSATGGNGVSSDSFTTGGSALTLPTPTRTGYTFAGWYGEVGLSTLIGAAGASYTTTSSATLYAKWNANSLTVTYNANGGSSVTSGSTTTGTSISSAPTAPTKAGYTFVGWYSDSGLTTAVTFSYSHGQTADFTLYAKWAAGTYTVTYNYNSATGGNTVSSDSFTTGGTAVTLPTPTRTSFQFLGWYDASTSGNLVGAGGASFTTATSIALYARWVQLSLAGIDPGDLVSVGTISASNLIDATFGATTNGSSVNVSVPTGALPNGTTITMNLVTNFTRVQNILTDAHNYVVSLIVSWLAPDGTVPTTATGKPISMTISNSSIRIGDAIYLVINGTATLVGRATSNGQVILSVTDDPEIVIASTRPYSVTNVTATDGDVESATISWTAPIVDGGSPITGYTVTSSGGQTCTTTTTSCIISGLTSGIAYTFNVVATNAIGSATAVTSSAITPAAAPVVTPPVSAPVTTPVNPPVTTPVVAPVTSPVTPPVTEPVTPPITEPVTPPVAEPVTKPSVPAKTISLGSSAIGMRLNAAQVATLKALKAKKGFTVTVYTKANATSGSKSALRSIASRISGAIKAAFAKLKTTTKITGGSKLKCTSPNGVCVAITATK